MAGNIYTDQKCLIPGCGGTLVHDERRQGCFCKKHPKIQATGKFRVKFGKDIRKRFKSYEKAYHYLIGLRYEVEQDKFDKRDHLASNPNGFSNLAKEYLDFKRKQKLKSFYHVECYINRAADYFKGTNVKKIKFLEIQAFLDSLTKTVKGEGGIERQVPLSDKTKANYASQLHDMFYDFLYKIELLSLADLPKFPEIEYELGFRKLISVQDREVLIDKLKKKTYHINPKIWLAVDMLCSYNKFRPQDLRNVKEGDIDLEYGVITIWRPTKSKKKKKPVVIQERLLDYHIDEIRALKKEYPATPSMPFFRHNGKSQAENDTPFGTNYLYKQWKKICKDAGIDDLDLYGATRHSTTHAIAKAAGRKAAKKFSGHGTNKAYDRYAQISDEESFDMTKLMAKMRGKIVDFDKAKGQE